MIFHINDTIDLEELTEYDRAKLDYDFIRNGAYTDREEVFIFLTNHLEIIDVSDSDEINADTHKHAACYVHYKEADIKRALDNSVIQRKAILIGEV